MEIFENFRVEAGRKRSFSNRIMSYITQHCITHALALSRGKGENDSNMLLEEVYFFEKTEIKKHPDTCGRGLNLGGEKTFFSA